MSNHDVAWDQLNLTKFYINGAVVFVGARFLVYPLILVKTRLQTQAKMAQYSSTTDAFKKIYKMEGMRGFFKGFFTLAWSTLPAQVVYLTTYERVRQHIKNNLTFSEKRNIFISNLIGGGIASLCSSCIGVPADVITQKLMIQDGKFFAKQYKGGVDMFFGIIKKSGVRGLYRGFGTSLLVYAPNSAIWWSTYTTTKDHIQDFSKDFFQKHNIKYSSKFVYFNFAVSGVVAGLIAAIITNPLDVIKTRIQTLDGQGNKPWNFVSMTKHLYNTEGLRAFKRGIYARILSTINIGTIMVLSYEFIKQISLK
eukprot:TRINITY_DN5417_c0_g1_i1.p1 TRINITY_DN5417_c0_g1~~TRINITY_DN5417_c0_g1_i1.p1  ORF type:complete len:309 (-),score=55.87 TRINITY_DN5417_c0_g1_i1:36-962(-)